MGDDLVVPIEKYSKSEIFDYDIKVLSWESDEAMDPYKATPDAAEYDLYAAEATNVLPKSNAIVSLDLRWAIPKGFFGKIFSSSGLLLNRNVTPEAGVIDSGYRGIVKVLLHNHSENVFSVQVGQRIAQIVFLEKFDVKFEMVQSSDQLEKSARSEGGFGSTGNNWLFKLFSSLIKDGIKTSRIKWRTPSSIKSRKWNPQSKICRFS